MLYLRSFLPIGWKLYNPENPDGSFFKSFFSVIVINLSIAVFGLIVGILAWMYTKMAEWYLFMPFLIVGEGHALYLYFFKVPPRFNHPTERNHKLRLISYILMIGGVGFLWYLMNLIGVLTNFLNIVGIVYVVFIFLLCGVFIAKKKKLQNISK